MLEFMIAYNDFVTGKLMLAVISYSIVIRNVSYF